MSGSKLLKRFLGFALALALVLWGCQFLYGYLLGCNNNLKSSWKLKKVQNAEVIALGPSTVLNMFDPTVFQEQTGLSSYNLATNNASPQESIAQLEIYLQHNKKPSYLLYEISPRSFDSRYLKFNTWRFAHQLDKPVVRKFVKQNSPEYARTSLLPFMRYAYYNQQLNYYAFQGLIHRLKRKKQAHYADGYERANYPFNGDVLPFLKTLDAEKGLNYEWLPEREKEFKELFDYIQAKDIKIFCYKTPVYDAVKPYLLNRTSRLKQVENFLAQENISFYNMDDLTFSKDAQYFFSCLHTNHSGTELVMKELSKAFLEQKNQMKNDSAN